MSNTNKKHSAYFDRIRLKHRKPETMNMDAGMFAQSLGLSRLAVDLARLAWQRGKSNREPSDFLDYAAHLVNEAAKLTGSNSDEALEVMMQESAAKLKANQTPLSVLFGSHASGIEVVMDDGKKFNFTPFTTERGWKDFLVKHFMRVLPEQLKTRLHHHLTNNSNVQTSDEERQSRVSRTQAAIDYLKTTRWDGTEHLLNQAAAESESSDAVNWPEAVLMRWVEIEAKWSADFWSNHWKDDGLNYATLQSLAETKQLGNRAKGSGKRRVAKKPEETGSNDRKKVEKQGQARKKPGSD